MELFLLPPFLFFLGLCIQRTTPLSLSRSAGSHYKQRSMPPPGLDLNSGTQRPFKTLASFSSRQPKFPGNSRKDRASLHSGTLPGYLAQETSRSFGGGVWRAGQSGQNKNSSGNKISHPAPSRMAQTMRGLKCHAEGLGLYLTVPGNGELSKCLLYWWMNG